MIPYLGGKYQMAKWINSFIPKDIETYAEPFGGAFWVYLKSDIKNVSVYYNDFNPFMVNMFRWSQNPHFLKTFESVESQNSDIFTESRDMILEYESSNKEIESSDLAWRYPYVLTQVFSGQVINKSIKMFNLKGKYKSKFDTYRDRLKDSKFRKKINSISDFYNLDFEKFINKMDSENTFFYVDPPYYDVEQDYYAFHDFKKDDHKRLADTLKKSKSRWILSYYEFPELSVYFPKDEYRWVYKEVYRPTSSNHKKSSGAVEVIIMNYDEDNNFKEWE